MRPIPSFKRTHHSLPLQTIMSFLAVRVMLWWDA